MVETEGSNSVSEIPILFSAPMVRAIQANIKTQTRRIIKPQPEGVPASLEDWSGGVARACGANPSAEEIEAHAAKLRGQIFPFRRDDLPLYSPGCKWRIGDLLWVRETWAAVVHGSYEPIKGPLRGFYDTKTPWSFAVQYRADYRYASCEFDDEHKGAWRPSIHMPKWACREWLRVTNIRVELLLGISEEDARAEGISQREDGLWGVADIWRATAKEAYLLLWDKINGPGASERNPYVWVVEFERARR